MDRQIAALAELDAAVKKRAREDLVVAFSLMNQELPEHTHRALQNSLPLEKSAYRNPKITAPP